LLTRPIVRAGTGAISLHPNLPLVRKASMGKRDKRSNIFGLARVHYRKPPNVQPPFT
jgi:hypothetical protein